jgi:hypothetical protein
MPFENAEERADPSCEDTLVEADFDRLRKTASVDIDPPPYTFPVMLSQAKHIARLALPISSSYILQMSLGIAS